MRVKGRMAIAAFAALAATTAGMVSVVSNNAGNAASSGGTIKAALVSDVGRFNDKGFNQFQLEGLQRAKRVLKVQTRAVESRSASDYIPNLSTPARQRYDIIISAGFLLAEATNTVARRFPNTTFAITDYSALDPPFRGRVRNVVGLTFAAEQNSYLIGCLAARMARRGNGRIISVTAGVKIPPVDDFVVGFRAGAKRCVPAIRVLVGYSQDFIAQDKCKEIALNQIAAGSKVVFNVAGPCGLGALDAARESNVWGIGVDKDQSSLGRHILTSAVKRVDQGIFLAIKGVKDGNVRGGRNIRFDLKNNGVAVGKISPRVPRAFIAEMNRLKAQIIAGKIKVPRATKG